MKNYHFLNVGCGNGIPLIYAFKKLPFKSYSGFDFVSNYVDISNTMELKTKMLQCHKSQNDWLMELYNDTPTNMMKTQCKFRGMIPGFK